MMKRILIALFIVVLAYLVYDFFLKAPSFTNGAEAPNFDAQLIDGSSFALSDLRGDYVLLDFWGSWCAPCRKEIPQLKTLYAQYHDRKYKDAENFHIVSVALEKSDAYTRQIIKNEGLNWDHHIIDVSRVVMLSRIAQLYDVKELPTKFLINPKGQIMGTNLSWEETSRLLDQRLSK